MHTAYDKCLKVTATKGNGNAIAAAVTRYIKDTRIQGYFRIYATKMDSSHSEVFTG